MKEPLEVVDGVLQLHGGLAGRGGSGVGWRLVGSGVKEDGVGGDDGWRQI